MAVDVEAIERGMAAARQELRVNPNIDSVEVADAETGVNYNKKPKPIRPQIDIMMGKKRATVEITPVEMASASPDRVRAIRCAMTREDCGTQFRTLVFERGPAVLTSNGVYIEKQGKERFNKVPQLMAINFSMVFGPNSNKELRRLGISSK